MTRKAFDKIAAGLKDAIAFAEGTADPSTYRVHVAPEIDVRAIRAKLNLTQAEFSARYGFNIARLRDWEQGRSRPDGAVRAYLRVIERKTEAVDEALIPERAA
jgi:putative transcriptional regulator